MIINEKFKIITTFHIIVVLILVSTVCVTFLSCADIEQSQDLFTRMILHRMIHFYCLNHGDNGVWYSGVHTVQPLFSTEDS